MPLTHAPRLLSWLAVPAALALLAGLVGCAATAPPQQTPAELCNAYWSSVSRAVVLRRIESGQIPESRADPYMQADARLGEVCKAVETVPQAELEDAYKAFLVELALALSDKVG